MPRRITVFLVLVALLSLPAQRSDAETSSRRAFWSSLLIPGWGQLKAGSGEGALRFFAIDVGLWAGFFGMQRVSDVRGEHYRTFAAEHAGARPREKDRRYFDDLGFYNSRLEHNQFSRREEGGVAKLYPDGPQFDWQWDEESSRLRYRSLRNDSESARRQALFATGFIVVNHLAAAIHAARSVRRSADAAGGQSEGGETSCFTRLSLELAGSPDGLGLMLRRRF